MQTESQVQTEKSTVRTRGAHLSSLTLLCLRAPLRHHTANGGLDDNPLYARKPHNLSNAAYETRPAGVATLAPAPGMHTHHTLLAHAHVMKSCSLTCIRSIWFDDARLKAPNPDL